MCISRRYPMKVLHTQWVMNTRPALLGRKGVSTGVALRPRVKQCLRILQVSGVKPLGEPVVDRCQQVVGFLALALLLPQAAQARGSPQLPGLGLLAAGNGQGLLEAGFRLGRVRDSLSQQQLSLEPVHLCGILPLPSVVHQGQRLGQQTQSFLSLGVLPIGLSQEGEQPRPSHRFSQSPQSS
jgi:hypothetical protein